MDGHTASRHGPHTQQQQQQQQSPSQLCRAPRPPGSRAQRPKSHESNYPARSLWYDD
jgi:hypothetical protein